MEKYGFVYIWFDRKHKRYYIGCRWGNINDEYICSSSWMKDSYKRRPQDFKRKILVTNINDRSLLLNEEYKWLSLIKPEELGKKYYNLHNHHFGHWTTNEENKKTIGQKISDSHNNDPTWGQWGKGKKLSDETKEKIREANKIQFSDPKAREYNAQKTREHFSSGQRTVSQSSLAALRILCVCPHCNISIIGHGPMAMHIDKTHINPKPPKIYVNTKNIVSAYDLENKKFVKVIKEIFINNKERYCGSTSKRIKENSL